MGQRLLAPGSRRHPLAVLGRIAKRLVLPHPVDDRALLIAYTATEKLPFSVFVDYLGAPGPDKRRTTANAPRLFEPRFRAVDCSSNYRLIEQCLTTRSPEDRGKGSLLLQNGQCLGRLSFGTLL